MIIHCGFILGLHVLEIYLLILQVMSSQAVPSRTEFVFVSSSSTWRWVKAAICTCLGFMDVRPNNFQILPSQWFWTCTVQYHSQETTIVIEHLKYGESELRFWRLSISRFRFSISRLWRLGKKNNVLSISIMLHWLHVLIYIDILKDIILNIVL